MKGSILLLVATASIGLAQTTTPPCVQSCETAHATSSFCNGDETGAALDSCTCQSFEYAPPLITCIKACPADQVSFFASQVPALCRGQLFPGVSASTSASGAALSSSSGSLAQTTSAPAGNTPTISATTTKTGTTSTSASSTTSQTAKSSGSAAMENASLDSSMVVAFIGGVIALMML